MPKNTKICPYPFSQMALGSNTFDPCCRTWLKPSYWKLDHKGDPWQSAAAKELRRSMLDGGFEYCKTEVCKVKLFDINEVDDYETSDLYIDNATIEKLRTDSPLDDIPLTSVKISVDNRCNLSCPSCRSSRITKPSPIIENNIFRVHVNMKKFLPNLRKLTFAGYTEFFFVDWTKKLVSAFNEKTAPKLKSIYLLTNGTLLNENSFNELGNGKKYVETIDVSIDAGDEETYKIVRGGNWKQLNKNLIYVKKLRKKGEISRFTINFVIQKDNLNSIRNFIILGEALDVDEIIFTGLLDWSQLMKLDYFENAIHLKSHPQYEEYLKLKNEYSEHPKVLWRVE